MSEAEDLGKMIERISTRVVASLRREAGAPAGRVDKPAPSAPLKLSGRAAEIAGYIDHTLLKQEATAGQIVELCGEARHYGFAAVCIQPAWVALAVEQLAGSRVMVATVAGFPQGMTLPEVKAYEAARVCEQGAHEVDMVINVGALKSGNDDLVLRDIAGVVDAAHARKCAVKVIIETSLLEVEEKIRACVLAKMAGADYVKTSTGFAGGGATPEDVALMRQVVGRELGVKAAGGIRTAADAWRMIDAGATRIGASAGVRIVQEVAEEPAESEQQ